MVMTSTAVEQEKQQD